MNSSQQAQDAIAGLIGVAGIGVFALVMIITSLISIALMIFIIICNWKLLEKAGEPGWKAIIPFYNLYTISDIAMTKPTSIVVFVIYMVAYALIPLTFIPYLGIVVSILISPLMYAAAGIINFSIPKAYGKDVGMCILSIFFAPIVRAILAFSKTTEYTGDKVSIIPASNNN